MNCYALKLNLSPHWTVGLLPQMLDMIIVENWFQVRIGIGKFNKTIVKNEFLYFEVSFEPKRVHLYQVLVSYICLSACSNIENIIDNLFVL